MRADLPSGTITFLFTDIEGSTQLLHALGPDAYAEALAEHRRALRDAFAAHGGVEVDTQGDAFFVAFPTAEGAADAALEVLHELAPGPISVRMGAHTGTPSVTREGYVGVDVHRGARVASLAHGGQVLLSPSTAVLLAGRPLRDAGLHRLKDFEGAIRLYQLGEGEFPPLRTPGSIDLPMPATRFLGRERELFEAVSLVYEHAPRVLTIIGPGGTGKTRFALELCRLLAEDAEGGTVFVPLAPLRDAELVLPTIADRLGAPAPDVETLAARVGDKRTHVLVDNVEHLLPEAARSLAAVATAAPELRLFATSREALRIQGEQELDLPPLAADEAVALFLARARAVGTEAAATPAVADLCDRLDRLPLALELAAARTKLLAPEQLLERLGDRLDLLKGSRDADERHATLRATIAWSYDLLDEEEQRLFRGLAVFRGGCTLELAEAVCDADLDTLASLLDKSLVRRRAGRFGEERFWMLETIRDFARGELAASDDVGAIHRRHAERMLEIARSAHLTEEDDEPFRLPLVLAEQDDMRGALDWATAHDVELALELLVALENFWNTHALEEVLTRLDELLPRAGEAPAALRAGALRLRGGALHTLGDFVSCDTSYLESLAIYRQLGDERGVASLLQRLGNSAYQRGDFEQARDLLTESQDLARGRFALIEVPNDTILARIRILNGDVAGGTELLRRSGEMAGEVGFDWWRAGVLGHLAFLALDRGDLDEARRDSAEALRLVRDNDGRLGTFMPLTSLARLALESNELRRAGLLWGAVEAEDARAPNAAWRARLAERARPLIEEARDDFLAAVEEGRELEVWDAVAIALGELELPQTVP